MKLLLDTHTILWFALTDPQLSATANAAILNAAHEKWVSPVSHWEVAIKISVGKYRLGVPFEDFWKAAIDANGFQHLAILPKHTAALLAMPYHHRDPFDRMLTAQTLTEGMALVSADGIFDQYGVARIW